MKIEDFEIKTNTKGEILSYYFVQNWIRYEIINCKDKYFAVAYTLNSNADIIEKITGTLRDTIDECIELFNDYIDDQIKKIC